MITQEALVQTRAMLSGFLSLLQKALINTLCQCCFILLFGSIYKQPVDTRPVTMS